MARVNSIVVLPGIPEDGAQMPVWYLGENAFGLHMFCVNLGPPLTHMFPSFEEGVKYFKPRTVEVPPGLNIKLPQTPPENE